MLIDPNFTSYRTIPGLGSHSSLRNHFTKTEHAIPRGLTFVLTLPFTTIHHHSPFTSSTIPVSWAVVQSGWLSLTLRFLIPLIITKPIWTPLNHIKPIKTISLQQFTPLNLGLFTLQDLQLARAALRSQGAGGLFCRDALGRTVLHHAAQGKPQLGQVTRRILKCSIILHYRLAY